MAIYKIKLVETLVYEMEIEADTQEQAEELAFNHEDFTSNNFTDNDSEIEEIYEIEE